MGHVVKMTPKTSTGDKSVKKNVAPATSYKILSDKFPSLDEKEAVNFQDEEFMSPQGGPPKKDDDDDEKKKKPTEKLLEDDNLIQKTFAKAMNTAVKIKGQI